MINLELVISIIGNTNVIMFFSEYIATKGLDGIISYTRKKYKQDSFEFQFINSLEDSLKELCELQSWEFDSDAILETFIYEWHHMDNTNEETLGKILSKSLGVSIDEEILKCWIYCFHKQIADPKRSWIYNFIIINKLENQLDKITDIEHNLTIYHNSSDRKNNQVETLQEEVDAYIGINNQIEESFSNNDEEKKKKIKFNWNDPITKQISLDILSLQSNIIKDNISNKNQDNLIDYNDRSLDFLNYNFIRWTGKHFSLNNPSHIITQVFSVEKAINPITREVVYMPILLDKTKLNGYDTYFVDCPHEDYDTLIILSFDQLNKLVHVNMGIAEQNKLDVSRSPIALSFKTTDFPASLFDMEIVNDDEYEYTYSLNMNTVVIIIDPENGEIIKPVVYEDKDRNIKAKIKLKPYKTYFAFFVKEKDSNVRTLDEYEFGLAYLEGDYYIEYNPYKARYWLEIAYKKGDYRAAYKLGYIYKYGLGVNVDNNKAFQLLSHAAKVSISQSYYELADSYENGYGVKRNIQLAIKYYKKSYSKSKNIQALINLGCIYNNMGNYEKALKYYFAAADKGNAKAYYYIALAYKEGLGIEKNNKKMIDNFEKASNLGDIDASVDLADLYIDGLGIDHDYNKALELLFNAAEEGSRRAMNNLGWVFKNGIGVEKDCRKALKLFKAATDKNSSGAYKNMGDIFLEGFEGKSDITKALECYENGSKLGSKKASRALAELYEKGDLVKCNLKKAMHYYKLACEQGFTGLEKKIAELELHLQ